jgi:putative DNA methylase
VTYKKKLIEVALPLAEISDASSKEKSVKHGHPANLHHWWARRPLAAARAVLFASLVDDPSSDPVRFPTTELQEKERNRLFDLITRLVPWDSTSDLSLMREAHAEITRCFDGEPPPVLDPFAGGGAIPLEAQRLGLTAFAGDLNPVATIIERSMLEIPPRFAGVPSVFPKRDRMLSQWRGAQGMAADLRAYGECIIEEARSTMGIHYPAIETQHGASITPIAWIWARTVLSPDRSWPGHVPLVRSWILGKRPGKALIWVEPVLDPVTHSVTYLIREGGSPTPGTVDDAKGRCIASGTAISTDYIKQEGVGGRIGMQMLAMVGDGPKGRVYMPPTDLHVHAALCDSPDDVPTGTMSTHPQYMGTPRYGLDEWHKLYTPRQQCALMALTKALVGIRPRIQDDAVAAGMLADSRHLSEGGSGAAAYAEAIATYLALAFDKLADLNNSLTPWEPIAQCPRHLFGRQSVPMVWDFAEANPFGKSSGSLRVVLDGIARVLEGKAFTHSVRDHSERVVEQRDAVARIGEVPSCVVCTDPPYYAQVPYADISDFFFVWMRRNLSDIWPDEFATMLTPKGEELVADEKRYGDKQHAAAFFEAGMEAVFRAVAERQSPHVPATVFYAYKATQTGTNAKSSTGWETFLQGLINAGMMVTATWPIRTENKSRLRAMSSNALASSIVLACRPRSAAAPLATRGELISHLHVELPPAVRLLQVQNILPVDLAQSAIGPGISIFSRFSRVLEADGTVMSVKSALGLINDVVGEILSGEEAEFDPITRFCLTWFDQYAHRPGPFGDADVLARAKDTAIASATAAGVVASRDGKVRLLGRAELPSDWDLRVDRNVTIWEATQHLIKKLDDSEMAAAGLLAQIGQGLGAQARQLSYLLYGVCERNNWSEDATHYNMLVTAWPEITKLAASTTSADNVGQLF